MALPNVSRLPLVCQRAAPTGRDADRQALLADVQAQMTADQIITAALSFVNRARREWAPPAPLRPIDFGPHSMAVFIAVKASDHRIMMQFALPKINATTPTMEGGELRFNVEPLGDDMATQVVNRNLPDGRHGFFFQPSYAPVVNPSDETVDATVYCLHFSANEIEAVLSKVPDVVALKSVTYGVSHMGEAGSSSVYQHAHLVLVVVANDSPYEDLSAHVDAPTALNTNDGRPNMMPVPLHKFSPGWSPSFVAPHLSVD